MLPLIKVFLDVDDLDHIDNLDEHIACSTVLLFFVSKGYFTSYSCQNEIKSTLKWRRPFFLVHESDPKNGGKPWAELVAECPTELEAVGIFGALPNEYIDIAGSADLSKWRSDGRFEEGAAAPTQSVTYRFAQRVVQGREPIMWHRIPDFQELALKQMGEHVVRHTPEFQKTPSVQLFIPGELLLHKCTCVVSVRV